MTERSDAREQPDTGFDPCDFFVLRTPLLPFDALERFGSGLEAPRALGQGVGPEPSGADSPEPEPIDAPTLDQALGADRRRLRRRLERHLEDPVVREALFLASPSLEKGLHSWRRDPEGKKGKRFEQALVRYLYRMAARSTPFGLFSGCSLGKVAGPGRLRLEARARYGRHTRLDMDYLFALTEALGRQPRMRDGLRYYPSSSLYRAAGRLRYVEARLDGRARSHHLVAVDAEEYLEAVLEQASGGATLGELARGLAEREEVSEEEAREFLDEMVDSQLLVSELEPPVTGREPIHDLIAQLRRHPAAPDTAAPWIRTLEKVRRRLEG
ncbi:MAG: lantibiotic dehydratase family protein, partial [Holophagales bacterium]|nr:lantibiotic dehydratase family protein [Holophagales bacterium]